MDSVDKKYFFSDFYKKLFFLLKFFLLFLPISIIIGNSGVFHKGSFKGAQLKNYNQYLSNLRTELKSLFNIDEDPFKANKPSGGHQTLFSCHSEIMLPTESSDLSPEDNTPKGIKKQTDAYQ